VQNNMSSNISSAIVVLSGGQDSTTCLFWAINEFDSVETVTFDYGQRHRIELEAAQKIAKLAGVKNTILPIDTFGILGGNSLTGKEAVDESSQEGELPNSFVPGRNLIFLTFAAAFAYQREIKDLVTGVCQTDYSGYPDCRQNTIEAIQLAINLGMESNVRIHTPLMWMTKSETVKFAEEVGALEALAWSHTCYNGEVPPCGQCPACELRAKGFEEGGIPDPLLERFT
jgi:7-cyano-7-deazaguanine synthase